VTGSPRGGRPRETRLPTPALAAIACGTVVMVALAGCGGRTGRTAPTDASPGDASPAVTKPGGAAQADVPGAEAVVVRVIDGDTVEVRIGGATEPVRLIGIDTPERTDSLRPAECYGDEATVRARQLLPEGSPIRLLRDVEGRDRYDRLLAYVFRIDGMFVNLELVVGGFAVAFPFEPNTAYAGQLDRAEADARRAGAGLWGSCGGPDVVLEG
jgi:micrococcal nuclease